MESIDRFIRENPTLTNFRIMEKEIVGIKVTMILADLGTYYGHTTYGFALYRDGFSNNYVHEDEFSLDNFADLEQAIYNKWEAAAFPIGTYI